MQSDLNRVLAEKDEAEQELSSAKLATERTERYGRQEQNRWQAEVNSYKQRLERADADIVHCRRENLRLSEQIASLEKEVRQCILKLIISRCLIHLFEFYRFNYINSLITVKNEQINSRTGSSNFDSNATSRWRKRSNDDDNGLGNKAR